MTDSVAELNGRIAMANNRLLVPIGQKTPAGYTVTGETRQIYGGTYKVVELTHEDVHNIHVSERIPAGYDVLTSGVSHGQSYYEIGKRIK